ncbi:putative Ig domain-containing protein [Synechococcus lacustris Tous-12m]
MTINDAEENEWIKSNFSSYKSVSSGGADFWIGLTDKTTEGQFEWVDGTPFAYSGFYNGGVGDNGSQNGMGNYPTYDPPYTSANWWLGKQLEFDRSIGEDYGLINAPSGNWNDLPNNHRDGSVGIAEIELAPNNTPTGTPTVTGTLKVGFTLTIDATTIKDSDNFTGYTPTFKYNWETSTDGTTWSKLTTTDGADNNNTYILTAAETSKKIRGVVSYLDGYGTNEVVNSVTSESTITPAGLPTQSLTLSAPSKTAIRSGISTTSAITYNVSTGNTALTGVGASLYFDSTQLSVSIAGDPFKTGLLGNAITADTSNADGDPKTDKVLSLSYLDFGGNFPGSGTTLPLTLANLNLVPTTTFSGSTLHLKGDPAIGFTATGADLSIAHNAAPVVNGSIPALSTNRYTPFSYTLKSDLFSDPDSSITLSATTNTGDTLPSWLTFNPTTRTLSGTPTIGGTINLNLSATDELGSISTPLSLKIKEVQSLSSSTTPIRYQRNKELTVPINYSTSDGSSTTGLSFKVHFNSSLLSFDSTTGITNKTQADLFQIGAIQQDTANSDNDATTDSFIPINIASFTGQFPTAGVPVKLADLIFKSLDKPIDPITGLKDTSINFSETEAASGYGFTATSASLKPLSFSLDVDRDGKVTALGDGLMIIRKLFGAAFAGDALINKAISPDSPYLNGIAYNTLTTQQKADVAAQVHANIQEGIDSKMLDVDKDGKTTALGDGLMVIRHLFGAAFAGAALTNKAISPDSPYFGPPANFAAVAANIDAMRPI